jgi:DNA-binding CsgD family transcriptional regulator
VIVGEPPRARELLAPRISELPAGSARARAHLLLSHAAEVLTEHEHHLELALAESAAVPDLRASALASKSMLLSVFRVERIREAQALAEQALAVAQSCATAAEGYALLALAWARTLRGLPIDDLSESAAALPEQSGLYENSIERPVGVRLAFRGQVAQAREVFLRLAALAEERGEYRFLATVRIQLCELALRAGDVRECERLLDRWDEWAAMEDIAPVHSRCQAMLAAIQGLPEVTQRWAAAVDAATSVIGVLYWDQLEVQRSRGIAALVARQPEQAASALGSILEHTRREGVDDPGAFPVAADLVEALVLLGRTGEAAAVTGRLRRLAERQRHPWGRATANRCAATIALAARYDDDQADRLAGAAAALGELGLGFERARSLLWLGQVARRARRRAAARRFLQGAADAFDGLGSDGWADLARAELARLGVRGPARAGQLTTAERRVADLATEGLSNKEIARQLFIAVHTVEVHLAHAYAKLGVRSRAQLASHLATSALPPVTD